MPRTHDPAREHRILYEVIVDAYDEQEEYMGWYYYLAENLRFPTPATARLTLRGGKSETKPVQIVEVDPKSEEAPPVRLGIAEKGSGRVQYLSPEEIVRLDTSPDNLKIINDWLYWHDFELLP